MDQVHVPRPLTFNHLNLQVVADGHHSVPTALTISTESGLDKVVLSPITDGRRQNTTVTVPISFPPLTGEQIQVTFTGVRAETTKNYYSHDQITLPLGIAELGLPGVDSPVPPPTMPGNCQSNLLTVDGRPVSVAVTGSTADALDGKTLTVSGCGPDASGITLGPGRHVIESASGHVTGFDIDQLVLDSAPGGGPEPETAGAPLPAPSPGPAAAVSVVSQTATTFHLKVTGATAPFWLTLGESVNKGWEATVDPGPSDRGSGGKSLGPSTLVDGFANGWLVDPATLGTAVRGGTFDVTLTWFPQKHVDEALVISALAAVLCLLLALLPNRFRVRIFFRRRRRRTAEAAGAERPNALGVVRPGVRDDPPALGSPLSAAGHRPVWWAFVVAPVVAGAVGVGVLTEPKLGLALAGLVLVVLIIRHLRGLLALTALGLTAATAVYTVKHQSIFHFPPGGWPINFEPASTLAWAAVVVLAADAIVEVARGGTRKPALAEPEPEPDPDPVAPDPVDGAPPEPAGAEPAGADPGPGDHTPVDGSDSPASPDPDGEPSSDPEVQEVETLVAD